MKDNYVSKNMNKVNRAAVHVDRKKDQKKGIVKHKPPRSYLDKDKS